MANQLLDSGSSSQIMPVLSPPLPSKPKAVFGLGNKKLTGIVAMVALYVIWGTTLSAMHFGIQTISPAIFAFSRYFIVAILLISFCLLKREALPSKKDMIHLSISGICLFTVGNATAIWAVKYIPTVLAGALMATTPFWMIGLAAMQPPKERLQLPVLLGMSLGFIGILTVLAPQFAVEFSGNKGLEHFGFMEWLSVIGMFSTTVFWAAGSLYAKNHPTQNSVFMTVGIQNLAASLAMLPFMTPELVSGVNFHVSLPSVLGLLYLVFAGTIIAVPCYYYILKNMPVSVASTFAYVSPIITMIVGHFFLGEALSPTMSIGAVLVLAGVVVVQGLKQKVAVISPNSPVRQTPIETEAA